MKQRTISWKLAELDRILNDPTAPLEPHRIWSLLDDVSSSRALEDIPYKTSRASRVSPA